MVTADGRVKLADFGIASLQGDPRLTATGRPSRTSSARHTVPIPPRPSGPPRT